MNDLERTAIIAGVLSSCLILAAVACLFAYLEERSRRRIWEAKMKRDWWRLPP